MTGIHDLSGRFVSVVGRIGLGWVGPDEPKFASAFCADRTHGQALGLHEAWYAGAGRDMNLGSAIDSAIGEAVERYSLRELDDATTFSASIADLDDDGILYIAPGSLASVTDPQVNDHLTPEPVPSRDGKISWMVGYDVMSSDPVAVPVQYVLYIDHHNRLQSGEPWWYRSISNGTAAGRSMDDACIGAMLELIERDAFMLMWYHKLNFAQVDVTRYPALDRLLHNMFGRARIDVRLFDLTPVHGVPVVIGVGRGASKGHEIYGFGGGSAIASLEQAAAKAIRELAGLYAWSRAESRFGDRPVKPEPVRKYSDHLRHYVYPEHQESLSFLFENRPDRAIRVGTHPMTFNHSIGCRELATHLLEHGVRTVAVDLTPPGVEQFGVRVVRVVSPDLIPLDCDHHSRHTNRERLFSTPYALGWVSSQPHLDDLNHEPHPFP